jgi:hypothetical protein
VKSVHFHVPASLLTSIAAAGVAVAATAANAAAAMMIVRYISFPLPVLLPPAGRRKL